MDKMPFFRCLLLAASLATTAQAQTPTQALAGQWDTVCVTAVGGTQLFQRCEETINSTAPDANMIAATGQRLEEIPGQARIATRDVALPAGAIRFDVGGVSVAGQLQQQADGGLGLRLDGDLQRHWSLFLSADLGRVNRRAGSNEAAFDARTHSLTAGVNWQPRASWLFGLALNHASENVDFRDSEGAADTRFTGVIATASHYLGDTWSVDAYAGEMRGSYDLRRAIHYTVPLASGPATVDAVAYADPDASRRLAGIGLSGLWSRSGWDRGFTLGYDATRTRIDPYQEREGAGLALAVPGREVKTRRGRADFTLGRTVSRDWGVWQPSLRVSWFREFGNERRRVGVRLVQDPLGNVIAFDTEDPDHGWGEVALGSVFTFTGGHSGFVQYQQRFGHAYLQERLLALGWRIEL